MGNRVHVSMRKWLKKKKERERWEQKSDGGNYVCLISGAQSSQRRRRGATLTASILFDDNQSNLYSRQHAEYMQTHASRNRAFRFDPGLPVGAFVLMLLEKQLPVAKQLISRSHETLRWEESGQRVKLPSGVADAG